MAKDPRKRQKQLERRKAKRKEKHQTLSRRQPQSLMGQMAQAAGMPVLHCCIKGPLEDQGLANVLVSRKLPDGRVAFAVFLVDRYCLGVKDAWGNVVTPDQYSEGFYPQYSESEEPRPFEPACVRKLIDGAVAYAAELGLSPHPGYRKVAPILNDFDPADCPREFEYGQDDMPLFIAGPHDSPAKCRSIVNTLRERLGEGGFHYFMPADVIDGEGMFVSTGEDEFDRLEEEEEEWPEEEEEWPGKKKDWELP